LNLDIITFALVDQLNRDGVEFVGGHFLATDFAQHSQQLGQFQFDIVVGVIG